MIFLLFLMLFGLVLMLFFIYQTLSDINDNILDLDADLCRGFIIKSYKKKGKK